MEQQTMQQFKQILELNPVRFVVDGGSLEHSSGDVFKVRVGKDILLADYDNALATLLAYIGRMEQK